MAISSRSRSLLVLLVLLFLLFVSIAIASSQDGEPLADPAPREVPSSSISTTKDLVVVHCRGRLMYQESQHGVAPSDGAKRSSKELKYALKPYFCHQVSVNSHSLPDYVEDWWRMDLNRHRNWSPSTSTDAFNFGGGSTIVITFAFYYYVLELIRPKMGLDSKYCGALLHTPYIFYAFY